MRRLDENSEDWVANLYVEGHVPRFQWFKDPQRNTQMRRISANPAPVLEYFDWLFRPPKLLGNTLAQSNLFGVVMFLLLAGSLFHFAREKLG